MKCPRCQGAELRHLDLGEREFIAVEHCPRCRGCWLDHRQLERLEAGVWSRVDGLDLASDEALSELLCPRCAASMTRVSPRDEPQLDIDRCPACHGLWLDHGEREALHEVAARDAAAHGGLATRPDGWSLLRWVTVRVADRWARTREE